MSHIIIKNLSLEFPIYGVKSRSLKAKIISSVTGGKVVRDAHDLVTVKALDNLSIELFAGDRVGLIGHNGSGKSTLLRVLAGIYEISNATVYIQGKVVSLLDIFLGMDMDATGRENILVRGLILGLSKKEIIERMDEIIEFSGIGEFIDLPMRIYSSGMAMRLAFATSTVIYPDILLMDEWLSVGDFDFNKKMKLRLNSMISKAKIVVIASHDHDLINSICNKKITLEHGKIASIEG